MEAVQEKSRKNKQESTNRTWLLLSWTGFFLSLETSFPSPTCRTMKYGNKQLQKAAVKEREREVPAQLHVQMLKKKTTKRTLHEEGEDGIHCTRDAAADLDASQ